MLEALFLEYFASFMFILHDVCMCVVIAKCFMLLLLLLSMLCYLCYRLYLCHCCCCFLL